MTDDTRLDARVRGALTDLPMPDDAQTLEALRVVLERSSGPRRQVRGWVAPVLVAAAVLLIALVVGTWPERNATVQPAAPDRTDALVGQWERRVTDASTPGWNGTWRVILTRDGILQLRAPDTVSISTEGASWSATAGALRTDVFVNSVCAEQPAGVYFWHIEGGDLGLAAEQDGCVERSDVFAGTWRRVP